ncbi:hypothetical protein BGX21_002384 [Mortierella sp. AD011]|nr:hypothetical protein BGX20_010967 [Mortierella sp. AD010]KAF9380354.1 hypothetical protein BGX21_002384 [Mortierella sp. AD011]
MKITSCLAILSATASLAAAFVNPTDPWGETKWVPGTTVNITWNDDNNAPLLSTNPIVDIFLNSGGDQSNIQMATIATGVDAGKTSSVTYTVPNVSPPGKIYFLTFITSASNKGATAEAWSTRFTITDASGNAGTLAPSAPVGSNSGAVGTIISTAVTASPTTGATGSNTTGAATITSPATATATTGSNATSDKPTSGAASLGASGLSAVAAAIVGAVVLAAF